MKQLLILFLMSLICFSTLPSHEGHKETNKEKIDVYSETSQPPSDEAAGRPQNWMQWIGTFHFVFLHFPIALISMAFVSELFYIWLLNPIFNYTTKFMLIAGAILSIPTALLGLTYSYTVNYNGPLVDFLWWHMWGGLTTAALSILTAILIMNRRSKIYYTCLFLLVIVVNLTAFLGGEMTFGIYHMLPPKL